MSCLLEAQPGQQIMPGRGLIVLHRGGATNPVVFAMSTSHMLVVLAAMIGLTLLLVRLWLVRERTVVQAPRWDGGIRRLLPEMTNTATGFSNPVSVVFEANLKPVLAEDRRAIVANHFREAIRRTRDEEHVVDRLVLNRLTARAQAIAGQFARIHHGQLTLYVVYGLFVLLAGFIIVAALRIPLL